MNLAERMFAAQRDDDELWIKVNEIMGFTRDKFEYTEFPIFHCYVDSHDESVEVIFQHGHRKMTDEEVLKVLDLGFGLVYASYGPSYADGDGILYHRLNDGVCGGKCYPRDNYYDGSDSNDDKALILKYREELGEFKTIGHKIYIARNITLDHKMVVEQLDIMDSKFREKEKWN